MARSYPQGKLRICMLSAEAAPLIKTGGLADAIGALTATLHAAGHEVRLVMPCYDTVDRAACGARPLPGAGELALTVGSQRYECAVLRGQLPGGAPVFLVDCPALYARGAVYTGDPDEHVRFLVLTRAALLLCERLGWSTDVIHCNDWHTAFAPLYLQTLFRHVPVLASTTTLLTVHNIGYQGVFGADRVADLGLPHDLALLHQADLAAGRIGALRHGILYAGAVNTVSPTHAREICSPEYGMGLEDSLQQRAAEGALSGILNGVDYSQWDPRRDPYLPAHFDAGSLGVKRELRRTLRARLGIEAGDEVPLLGIVSRLALQKGIELLVGALPGVLAARPLTFAALGSGEAQYEAALTDLARRFPGRVAFRRGYDEELAHWIEAASDMFVMPSRYEPCGLNQMYSLRYGTVPVVRRTGGLADSVTHFDPATGAGTGVVFNDFDVPALSWALHTALDLHGRPADWQRLVHNGMACDFSWTRQAQAYLELYARLSSARTRG